MVDDTLAKGLEARSECETGQEALQLFWALGDLSLQVEKFFSPAHLILSELSRSDTI